MRTKNRKFPVMISLDFRILEILDKLAAEQRQTRSAYVRTLIDQAAKTTHDIRADE